MKDILSALGLSVSKISNTWKILCLDCIVAHVFGSEVHKTGVVATSVYVSWMFYNH